MSVTKNEMNFSEFLTEIQKGNDPKDYEFSWEKKSKWFVATKCPPDGDDYPLVYRKKQKKIVINGFCVPAPETKPLDKNQHYFFPNLYVPELYGEAPWYGDQADMLALARGIVHLTKEAAIRHAKAMLGIDSIS